MDPKQEEARVFREEERQKGGQRKHAMNENKFKHPLPTIPHTGGFKLFLLLTSSTFQRAIIAASVKGLQDGQHNSRSLHFSFSY
jgi:hypothetical protein